MVSLALGSQDWWEETEMTQELSFSDLAKDIEQSYKTARRMTVGAFCVLILGVACIIGSAIVAMSYTSGSVCQ